MNAPIHHLSTINFEDSTVRVLLTTGFFPSLNSNSSPVQSIDAIRKHLTVTDPSAVLIIARNLIQTHDKIWELVTWLGMYSQERLWLLSYLVLQASKDSSLSDNTRNIYMEAHNRIAEIL